MLGIATFGGLFLLLAIGTWRRPAVAFAAVLCLYGLKQWGQDTSPFLVEHRTIANFMVAILVGFGLLRMSGQERMPGAKSLSLPWVLGIVLYLYAFMTLAWTPDLPGALQEWGLQIPYVLLVAFAAPLLLRSYEDVQQVCHWLVLVGGALCALALFLGHWGGRGLLLSGDSLDQEANPLAIASLAGTVCVMAMLSIQHSAWWRKLLYAGIVPIALATIIRSGSRGQLLATGLALLLGWPLVSSKRNLGAWLMLAAAAGVLDTVGSWIWQHLSVDSARWSSLQSQEDVHGRLTMAAELLRYATASPASFFFGLGNSSSFYYLRFYPHIVPAEVLGEEGLVGMAIYLSMLVATCSCIWRLTTASDSRPDTTVRHAYGVLAALFAFEFILTTKQGSLLGSTYVIAYAAILGRMVHWRRASIPVAAPPEAEVLALPFTNLLR